MPAGANPYWCSRHPASPAAWECIGCGNLLCPDCAEGGVLGNTHYVSCSLCRGATRELMVPGALQSFPRRLVGALSLPVGPFTLGSGVAMWALFWAFRHAEGWPGGLGFRGDRAAVLGDVLLHLARICSRRRPSADGSDAARGKAGRRGLGRHRLARRGLVGVGNQRAVADGDGLRHRPLRALRPCGGELLGIRLLPGADLATGSSAGPGLCDPRGGVFPGGIARSRLAALGRLRATERARSLWSLLRRPDAVRAVGSRTGARSFAGVAGRCHWLSASTGRADPCSARGHAARRAPAEKRAPAPRSMNAGRFRGGGALPPKNEPPPRKRPAFIDLDE